MCLLVNNSIINKVVQKKVIAYDLKMGIFLNNLLNKIYDEFFFV